MILVDHFEISILNHQITNVILEFQLSKGKHDIPRLRRLIDEQSDQGVRVYNTVCTRLKQYAIIKHSFEFKGNIQSHSVCVSTILGQLG